jgi:hypothetical protein
LYVERCGHSSRQDRADLRPEHEVVAVRRVVERLDAHPVPAEHELPQRLVPHRDGEHPFQPPREVRAVLLVEVRDDLRIGGGGQPVPPLRELAA